MLDEIYQEIGDNMGKSITSLENEFKRIRTGRASLSILDGIRVERAPGKDSVPLTSNKSQSFVCNR